MTEADPQVQARRAAVDQAVAAIRDAFRVLEVDGTVSYVEMLLALAEATRDVAGRAALGEWQADTEP